MKSTNIALSKAIYRSILRCSRTLENSPALKAVLQIDPENLPHSSCLMLRAYLGLRDFYIPDLNQSYTIVDRIKQGSRLTRNSTTIEDNLKVLKFINNVIQKGRKFSLIGREYKYKKDKSASVKLVNRPAPGVILLAHPMLSGWFKRTVLYLVSHNEYLSLGLCINKPLDLTLGDMQKKVESALSNLHPDENEVSIEVKDYGTLRVQPKKEDGSDVVIKREREARVEETASYRESLRDAQEETRAYYDLLAKKQIRGVKLTREEEQSMAMAQKFLNIPVTLKERKDEDLSESRIESSADNEQEDQNIEELSNATIATLGQSNQSESMVASSVLFKNRVHNGGPVESVNVLHNISSFPGVTISGRIKFVEASDFYPWKNYIGYLDSKNENIRLFLGECTWSAGQLEDELKQGCWIMCKTSSDYLDLLDGKFRLNKKDYLESLWRQLLVGLGGEYAEFSRIPPEIREHE
eukprot:g8140.t1